MNRITSHAEFTLVCVACVVCICGRVCMCTCVCICWVSQQCFPEGSFMQFITHQPHNDSHFGFSFPFFLFSSSLRHHSLTPCIQALPVHPSPPSILSLGRSLSLTHSGSECGTWGPLCGFFLRCCYLVAVIMKAGARDGGMKGWRDGVLFCDGCQ